MLRAISRIQSITISLIFLAFFIGNAFFLQSPILGACLLLFWLIYFGTHIGRLVAMKETPAIGWWIGAFILLSSVIIIGSAAYYIAAFSAPVALSLVILSIPVALWAGTKGTLPWPRSPHNLLEGELHRIPSSVYFLTSVSLLLLFLIFRELAESGTLVAIRSPWQQIAISVFVAMFILLFLLFVLLYRGKERALSLLLVSSTLFAFLSIALFVYPIGFGFDSFIHIATESHIAEFGTITPKPFYYIGQYSLVLFLHYAFALPVELADKLLLPILTSLLLPIAIYSAAAHLLSNKRYAAACLMAIFLLPLSSFIVTTPQGLANLWTLLIILAAIPFLLRFEHPRIYPLFIAATATLATHPISGIPAVLFVSLLASDPERANKRLKVPSHIVYWLILILGSVILPISFIANSVLSGTELGLDLSALNPNTILSALRIDLFFENRFNPILDFVYLYGFNAIALIVLMSGIGWFVYRKSLDGRLRTLFAMFFMLVINYVLLLTAVDFTFLIDYERLNYAKRLIPLMTFFLTPFVLLFFGYLISRLKHSPVIIRAVTLILLAAIGTSAFYITYPRDDAYERAHGFNVSQSDINAVYAIEDMAGSKPYAVLANQSVSAAAIRNIGFTNYYGDLFFYPIPTGGELYELFLEMNESPNKETAKKAQNLLAAACQSTSCDLGAPETIFYVVNDYWWQADRLIETAKNTADEWISIDDGAIYIFAYKLSEE